MILEWLFWYIDLIGVDVIWIEKGLVVYLILFVGWGCFIRIRWFVIKLIGLCECCFWNGFERVGVDKEIGSGVVVGFVFE